MRLTFAALTLALFASGGAPLLASEEVPPHIVLIYADDLGYGDLGVYGHHTIQTPNLDQLAADGLRLTHYYAPSPLCSPSRAALMTGRTPFRSGIESWIPQYQDVQLGPQEITLATMLKQKGYETFLGGKWHLNGGLDHEPHTQPEDHGFDHWLALHAFPIPHNHKPTNFFRNGEALGEVEGYTGDIVIDEAIEWLESRDGKKPLFLYLAMVEPHSTLANPVDYNEMYSQFTEGEIRPIVNGLPSPPLDLLEARGPGEYYANVTYLDHQLGRFLNALDSRGLRDSTLVFFASDNGPVTTAWRHWWEVNLYGSTGGLRGRKADLYEGGIREPAILRWPGHIAPGGVSDAMLSGYDLLPTLASIVGFEVPTDRPIDGEDFSALFAGEEFARERPLYWEFDDDQGFHYAIRDGDWKLLTDYQLARTELYNLLEDPLEMVELSAERPEVLARMLDRLRAMAKSVADDPLKPR